MPARVRLANRPKPTTSTTEAITIATSTWFSRMPASSTGATYQGLVSKAMP